VRILLCGLVVLLAGCIAEDEDEKTTNEQGEEVSDATLALSGFWDGQFDADTADSLRVLIYNGNIYGLDEDNGYYGTVSLNTSDQTVLASADSYALNAASEADAKQFVADGSSNDYEFDTQLTSLVATNDSLFGSYSIDSTPSGNMQLTRDGTWDNNSPLSNLTRTGKWTATNHELVMTRAGDGVTFTGVSTSTAGCNFRGRITNLDTNYNLYRVVLTERENCAAFNETNVNGLAGFNSDGDIEFYFRDNNAMLFMTFTPPAQQSSGGDSGGDSEEETPAVETPAT